jgi:hypothetical protein
MSVADRGGSGDRVGDDDPLGKSGERRSALAMRAALPYRVEGPSSGRASGNGGGRALARAAARYRV